MNNQNLNIQELKELIGKNSLTKVFTIINLSRYRDIDMIIQQYREFEDLQKEAQTNESSYKERYEKQNVISEKLLNLFNKIEENPYYELDENSIMKHYVMQNAIEYNKADTLLEGFDKKLIDIYIDPQYKDSQSEEEKENLENYIDEWLSDKSTKRNLALLGSGGIGKSSFLKRYFIEIAKKIEDGEEFTHYPIYFSLNKIANQLESFRKKGNVKNNILSKYILQYVTRDSTKDLEYFEKLHQNGKILFILDGFDEMGYNKSENDQYQLFEEIKLLSQEHQGTKLIIAGRSVFFRSTDERRRILNSWPREQQEVNILSYFEEVNLIPLSDDRILSYMNKFLGEDSENVEKLEWIKSKEGLYKISQQPFYLTIICSLLHNNNTKEESESPIEKYTEFNILSKYVSKWLNWQTNKDNFPASLDKIKPHDRELLIKEIFHEIAISFYGKGQIANEELGETKDWATLDEKFINNVVKTKLDKNDKGISLNNEEIKTLVDEVIIPYFLKQHGSNYQFLHDSFFYYFIMDKIKFHVNNKDFSHPIMKDMEWNNKIIDLWKVEFQDDINQNPSPSLLYLRHPEKKAKRIDNKFRWISSFILSIITPFYYFICNPLTIIFIFAALALYFTTPAYSIICWTIAGASLGIIAFVMTKKQWIWNKIFRTISKERRTNYNFNVKAYKIAFEAKEITPQSDIDLFVRLFSTYTIFPRIEDVVFDDVTILKHNVIDVRFKNFKHINGRAIASNIRICHFENVEMTNTQYYMVSWENCKFRNMNFENMGYNGLIYNQLNLIRKILKYTGCLLNSKNPSMYLMEFTGMNESDIDDYSLTSLSKFIKANNLKIGEHVQGEPWFEEKLKAILH